MTFDSLSVLTKIANNPGGRLKDADVNASIELTVAIVLRATIVFTTIKAIVKRYKILPIKSYH